MVSFLQISSGMSCAAAGRLASFSLFAVSPHTDNWIPSHFRSRDFFLLHRSARTWSVKGKRYTIDRCFSGI